MINLNFGIPKKDTAPSWNFNPDEAYIKIEKNRGHRKAKRIFLNKKAYDLLANNNTLSNVGVSFIEETKEVVFANMDNNEEGSIKITKNAPYKLLNSPIYLYLTNFLNLSTTEDTYIKVEYFEYSTPCFKLLTKPEITPDIEESIVEDNLIVESTIDVTETASTVAQDVDVVNNTQTEIISSPPEILQDIDEAGW